VVPTLRVPLTDEVISVRPFTPDDRSVLVAGRDAEFLRFLGTGSPEPNPISCIYVADTIVGWIDYDRNDRAWLGEVEVNVGYNVFPPYRGNGYATRALTLITEYLATLDQPLAATLLIDPANVASLIVATRAGFREVVRIDGQLLLKYAG
jgi:RimJ/RimL family protein N-acetyltransferase